MAALLGLWLLGEGISAHFALPVSGSVIGLVLLFVILCLRGGIPDGVAEASDGLLKYLAMLFVPAGVGIMVYGEVLLDVWLPTSVAVVLATLLTLGISATVMAVSIRLTGGRPQ